MSACYYKANEALSIHEGRKKEKEFTFEGGGQVHYEDSRDRTGLRLTHVKGKRARVWEIYFFFG